jgi:hypothetical protein
MNRLTFEIRRRVTGAEKRGLCLQDPAHYSIGGQRRTGQRGNGRLIRTHEFVMIGLAFRKENTVISCGDA